MHLRKFKLNFFKKNHFSNKKTCQIDPLDSSSILYLFFFSLTWMLSQLARTSTNPTGPEVNDHVSLQ
jgi:hypothetical protein